MYQILDIKRGEKMLDRHMRFCEEYLIDMNASRAYTAVYGGENNQSNGVKAHKLLKNAKIQEYIQQKLEEIKSEKIADITEIMEYLSGVMRGEHTEQTVTGNGKLVNVAVRANDRIRCAELLGKRYGMFTDKMKVEGAIPIVINEDLEE